MKNIHIATKKSKKLAVLLVSIMAVLCLVCGFVLMWFERTDQTSRVYAEELKSANPQAIATEKDENATHITTESELLAAGLTAGSYILDNDIILTTSSFNVKANVTLDLAGHILKYAGSGPNQTNSATAGSVIHVFAGANFTLNDSDVTTKHYYTQDAIKHFMTFFSGSNALTETDADVVGYVQGGVVTGGLGTANDNGAAFGGGVFIGDRPNSYTVGAASFTMNGGTIAGNRSGTGNAGKGGGIMVWTNSSLTINGGAITGNWCGGAGGGAVFFNGNNTLNISGNPVLYGNYNFSKSQDDDVSLTATNVNITGTLTEGVKIGFTGTTASNVSKITNVKDNLNGFNATEIFPVNASTNIVYMTASGTLACGVPAAFVNSGTDYIGYAAFADAVTAFNEKTADDNATLQLYSNATTTETTVLSQNGIFDLNGKVLSAAADIYDTVLDIPAGVTITVIDSNPTATHAYDIENRMYVLKAAGTRTLTGGVITGGTDGGILVSGNLKLEGGNVVGNCSEENGGGILLNLDATLSVKNKVVVFGNARTTTEVTDTDTTVTYASNDIYLGGEQSIQIAGNIENSKLGITLETDGTGIALTSGYAAGGNGDLDFRDTLFMNNTVYAVNLNDSEIKTDRSLLEVSDGLIPIGYNNLLYGVNKYNAITDTANRVIKLHSDVETTSTIVHNGNGTIDLNGHKLKYTGTDKGSVLKFTNSDTTGATTATAKIIDSNPDAMQYLDENSETAAQLKAFLGTTNAHIAGGLITGGNAEKGGGIYVDDNTSVTLNGGVIAGNYASQAGGGIYLSDSAVLTIAGQVFVVGNVVMNTDATNLHGGGIYVADSATFNVAGFALVTYNFKLALDTANAGNTVKTNNNVELGGANARIAVVSALNDGTTIGVTTYNGTYYDSSLSEQPVFATGYAAVSATAKPATFFAADVDNYIATIVENTTNVTWKVHTHEKMYRVSADKSTLQVICLNSQGECPFDDYVFNDSSIFKSNDAELVGKTPTDCGSISLTEPSNTVYNGKDITANKVLKGSIVQELGFKLEVTYTYTANSDDTTAVGTALAAAESQVTNTNKAGIYRATITVKYQTGAGENDYETYTIYKDFIIEQRAITVQIDEIESSYGQGLKALTAKIVGGTIAEGDENIYTLSTTATESSNAGTYAITAVCNNANYDITFVGGENAYTISKLKLNGPTASDKVYESVDAIKADISDDYTVVNTEESDNGTVHVTLALADKTNTAWADGTEGNRVFDFTIPSATSNAAKAGESDLLGIVIAEIFAIVILSVWMYYLLTNSKSRVASVAPVMLLAASWELAVVIVLGVIIIVLLILDIYLLLRGRKLLDQTSVNKTSTTQTTVANNADEDADSVYGNFNEETNTQDAEEQDDEFLSYQQTEQDREFDMAEDEDFPEEAEEAEDGKPIELNALAQEIMQIQEEHTHARAEDYVDPSLIITNTQGEVTQVVKSFDEATNTATVIRLRRSFMAKLRQSSVEIKAYYTTLKNEILSYTDNIHSKITWNFDSIYAGKDQIVKFAIRKEKLIMYLGLTPEEVDSEKYKVLPVNAKRYKRVACMYTIQNTNRVEHGQQLIAQLAKKIGLKKGKQQNVNYYEPYEDTKTLLENGLIKQVVLHESLDAFKKEQNAKK